MLTTLIVFERCKSMKCKSAQMHFVKKIYDFSQKQYQAGYLKVLRTKIQSGMGLLFGMQHRYERDPFFKPIASFQRGIDATDR